MLRTKEWTDRKWIERFRHCNVQLPKSIPVARVMVRGFRIDQNVRWIPAVHVRCETSLRFHAHQYNTVILDNVMEDRTIGGNPFPGVSLAAVICEHSI
ncbi:MAG: hypothetical protein Rhob2KO_44410 [Rhodopirellula baltica]